MMKVILIILDGLDYHIAKNNMGYLLSECQAKNGHLRSIQSVPPALSRPLYETILTGKTAKESGITHNDTQRLSTEKSIFHHTKNLGKVGAAAASHWFSELYNHTPFEPIDWRFIANPHVTIPYGIFYFDWHYPDSHTFADAEYLRTHYHPDFLLIHPMGIDYSGARYGHHSMEYHTSIQLIDSTFAHYLPRWLAEDYQVFITSDHALNNKNIIEKDDLSKTTKTAENLEISTTIPLFIFGNQHQQYQHRTIKQTDICEIICHLLEKES